MFNENMCFSKGVKFSDEKLKELQSNINKFKAYCINLTQMKIEIDTTNKTIKVLDECTIEEVLDLITEISGHQEYKFIPNTVINTIRIKDNSPMPWATPSPFTSPTKPWWEQPYTVTY